MNRAILLGLCLCLSQLISAQDFRFGLSLNVALSKVQSNFPFPEDYFLLFKPSGKFGFVVEKKLSEKSALGMELLWVILEGEEYRGLGNFESVFTSSGGAAHQDFIISDGTRIHSHYIGVPAYYRYSFGRIAIKGGLQALILASINIEKYKSNSAIFGGAEEPIYNARNGEEIRFRKYNLGPQVGIDVLLSDHFRLRVDYYHGLTDLYADGGEWQRRNQQLSFGLDYWLGKEGRH